MKFQMTYFATTAALFFAAVSVSAPVTASADTVEAPVARAFVPSVGYDDNDNVTIRIEGSLPDACYVLSDRTINRTGKTFTIQQNAWRRDTGACSTGDLLTEATYSVDVSLGQLTAGNYQVAQTSDTGVVTYVGFNVAPAKTSAVDEHPYADVTQVSVDDIVQRGKDVVVTIQGLYSSSCAELKQPISIQQLGAVFVIKPIEIQKPGVSCNEMILRLFKQTVNLGPQTPGEYLVHVRASAGRAVEQTFTVLRPNDPPISLN